MIRTPCLLGLVGCLLVTGVSAEDKKPTGSGDAVSYYQQIRPIFQANCHGCHQPAKARGDYSMTDFAKLLAGGESGSKAIVPGEPGESHLIELITPDKDGKAEMPEGKPALNVVEIDLIKRWITEGAKDDTPAGAKQRYDAAHPPIYSRPSPIASLDYSPDGKLLAAAGFHEVLLIDTATSEVAARLIGISERIESVRFSPDGKKLAVAGGLPGRQGEIQVWDVASRKLTLSTASTFDTIYGASWSPDSKLIAFGCGDNSVRAIKADTGEQVLFQGAHTDWVRDTAFSVDGSHLVSVGRDMSVKLTEVATQRFIDNVTSITPGALKGGIQAVVRHPKIDHIVVGGSDGMTKVYRLFREAKRVIGDDANHVFDLFPMSGRIFGLSVSADGKRIAAGSSLDGTGEVLVVGYDYASDVPGDLKAILGKVPGTRSPAEKELIEAYKKKGTTQVSKTTIKDSAIYAVAISPDGKLVAAAGGDGQVRLVDADSGKIVKQFTVVPKGALAPAAKPSDLGLPVRPVDTVQTEQLPQGAKLVAIDLQPKSIEFRGPFDYVQLLVTGKLESGETPDITRIVKLEASTDSVRFAPTGLVQPKSDGEGTLTITLAGQTATIPYKVSGQKVLAKVDFVHDVNPVLSKLGCNQGTCHGSAKGKNGFKLSLRGYDPIFDIRALTDDLAARRINPASPDDSMMLLKAAGTVPHMGGQLTKDGDAAYEIIRNWIHNGAGVNLASPRVARIDVLPLNPVVPRIGDKQQIRVMATYVDGKTRDVTQESFIDSGDTEVATASRLGLMTAVRRGEAPILVRYEGAYAATTITVMGDRTGFVWKQPETWGKIDELVANKWQRMKIEPSELAGDTEFIRRVYIDLTGLPPSADDVRAFLADKRPTREKRDALVDKLVGSEGYIDYWTNKWADLLQVNRKFLGAEGALNFRSWIRDQVANNTPYDKFAHTILTASGSNRENPAASYYKILREPTATMENTTHLFLAVRFNCNKCHDHPFEKWTQDQYYETSAFFAQIGLKNDPKGGDAKIGGTAVEGAKPLYEVVFDNMAGDVTHERTGAVTPPKFPYPAKYVSNPKATRREQMASWMTSADNQFFAKSYVNRLWGYLFGIGIMEPIDDLRAGNPPTNPELIDYLTQEFIRSNFNVQHVLKLIAKSRTYQLSFRTNKWNNDDKLNYSHSAARRLPAEVLYDTIYASLGAQTKIPGVKPGTRAAALPDSGVELPSGFLATFGRPVRESACECERSAGMQLGPVMALVSGPTLAEAIADPANALAKLVQTISDDRQVVNELFLRILNRPATDKEVSAVIDQLKSGDGDHDKLVKALAEREAFVAPIRAKQEKDRELAIAKAKADIEAHTKAIEPAVKKAEEARLANIKKQEEVLKAYETTELPKKQVAWEKTHNTSVEWHPLRPSAVTATKGVTLAVEADRAVYASAPDKETRGVVYTVDLPTQLQGITALRLEALADERLPGGGPGLAGGNFVINSIELTATSIADAKKFQRVVLQRPQADFSQDNFAIARVLDVNPNNNQGWAVGGGVGSSHWAVFEAKEAIGFPGGTKLSLKINQNFNQPKFLLGRFRVSVATAKSPVPLGLSEDLQAVLAIPAQARDKKQADVLAKYYRNLDKEVKEKAKAVADARQPLPRDPKLVELEERLALVEQPIPLDGRLAQLREDVKMSAELQKNKRLAAAQDLAWALINSPAFLFNH